MPAIIIGGGLLWRLLRRRRIRSGALIPSPPGIDELYKTTIGGIDQWLHIRGTDRANPVLLFLHGGPGAAGIAFGRPMQAAWERDFTVVQWDQRGGGKTFTGTDPAALRPTMTLEQFTQDAIEVVTHLCGRLGQQKIALLGHSWGTYLGLAVAHRRPELVSAYVGSGQMVCPIEFEAMAYDRVLEIARRRHDRRALALLASIPRPPSRAADFVAHHRAISRLFVQYLDEIYGRKAPKPDLLAAYLAALCSPEYTLADVMSIHRGALFCLRSMFGPDSVPGVSSIRHADVRTFGTQYRVPLLLFLGRHDYATPSSAAADWFATVEAPTKRLVWFEGSGHSPMTEEPAAYHAALQEHLLPLIPVPGRTFVHRAGSYIRTY